MMIGRHQRVEAEHFRAVADERGAMAQTRKVGVKDWADYLRRSWRLSSGAPDDLPYEQARDWRRDRPPWVRYGILRTLDPAGTGYAELLSMPNVARAGPSWGNAIDQ